MDKTQMSDELIDRLVAACRNASPSERHGLLSEYAPATRAQVEKRLSPVSQEKVASRSSVRHKLNRVRKPRTHLTYHWEDSNGAYHEIPCILL